MTTYLAFNEADGLDSVTDVIATTQNTGVARAGFGIAAPAAVSRSRDSTIPTALTEGWVHLNMALKNVGVFANVYNTFQILDAAGAAIAWVQYSAASGNTVSTDVVTNNSSIRIGTSESPADHSLSFNIKLDATTGFIKIYDGSSLVLNDSNIDTTVTSGVTTFDTLRFTQKAPASPATLVDGSVNSFSQVVVSDQNVIGCKLYTLTHIAGSINDWDTGAITDVDETGIDDTDKATTTVNGDQFTMDTSDTLVTPTLPNKFTSVILAARMSYDTGSAVTKATPLLNDTTATSTSYGTQFALTTGLVNYQQIWDVDPSDSGSWNETRINNYEFGVRADT